MAPIVLVVDDEAGVNDLVCDALRLAGYQTVSVPNGAQALQVMRDRHIDLVVLDVSMPAMDGFTVLKRMRDAGDRTAVVLLTARRSPSDVRAGFELGADDFVRKPFGIEELALRVGAVLRRTTSETGSSVVSVGRVRLDGRAHQVRLDGEAVDLSRTEFRLLQVLMESAGEVLTKDLLLRRIWGLDADSETTVLETYISYLRRKLGDGVDIRTVRGVGYQLVGEPLSP